MKSLSYYFIYSFGKVSRSLLSPGLGLEDNLELLTFPAFTS